VLAFNLVSIVFLPRRIVKCFGAGELDLSAAPLAETEFGIGRGEAPGING